MKVLFFICYMRICACCIWLYLRFCPFPPTTKCLPVICFGSFGLTGYTPSHKKKKCPLVPLPKSIALKSARFFHHLCLIADFGMYLLLVARTLCDISLIRFASIYFIGTNFCGDNFSRGEKNAKFQGLTFVNARLQPISCKINFRV